MIALVHVVQDDAKLFANMPDDWKLGYWAALTRLESYLRYPKKED
jgi:hypothetical protein